MSFLKSKIGNCKIFKNPIEIDYFIESAPNGFFFTSRKTLETNEWVSKVLQRVNKIRTKHFLWCQKLFYPRTSFFKSKIGNCKIFKNPIEIDYLIESERSERVSF